jgi:hypothetical protein
MPRFSDAGSRLNSERQQLRVILMHSRMAAEQTHVKFAKHNLLTLSEVNAQKATLQAMLMKRTQVEAALIATLESQIPLCQQMLDFIRSRLIRLSLEIVKRQNRQRGNQAIAGNERQQLQAAEENDDLQALASIMSDKVDAGSIEYGALAGPPSGKESNSDEPVKNFERIIQVEVIDSDWERVQIETCIEIEVPVEYPWRESQEWTEHKNSAGQLYYFHTLTEASQWEEPDWPAAERPKPLLEKVQKVEWVKRRRNNSQHVRRKRTKLQRRQIQQQRSSMHLARSILQSSDTGESTIADQTSQDMHQELDWLKVEQNILQDALQRLQDARLLSIVQFHNRSQQETKLVGKMKATMEEPFKQ